MIFTSDAGDNKKIRQMPSHKYLKVANSQKVPFSKIYVNAITKEAFIYYVLVFWGFLERMEIFITYILIRENCNFLTFPACF